MQKTFKETGTSPIYFSSPSKTEINIFIKPENNFLSKNITVCKDIKEEWKYTFQKSTDIDTSQSKCLFYESSNNQKKCHKCNEILTGSPNTHCCINGFRCEFCGKIFPAKSKRERHLRTHSKKPKPPDVTIFCDYCNKSIKKYNYRRHMAIHERVGPVLHRMPKSTKPRPTYVCGICNKDCVRKQRFLKHQRYHENLKRHPCLECDQSFKHYVELVRHVSKVHRQIQKGTECPICKETVLTINNHLKTHQSNARKCKKCHVVLTDHYSYRKHARLHRIYKSQPPPSVNQILPPEKTADEQYIQCKFCIERFPNFDQYCTHYKTHLRFVKYPCPYCPKKQVFQSVVKLLGHVALHHNHIPRSHVQCHICQKIMFADLLETHLKNHTFHPVECEACDQLFQTKYEYKDHMKMSHNQKISRKKGIHKIIAKYSKPCINFKKICCFTCHNVVRASHVRSHLKKCHQSFRCFLCKKSFYDQTLLEMHQRKHQRLALRCPACSHSFLSHVRLLAHLRKAHKMSFTFSKACPRCFL